ncbi:MAG TPA: hypothetical protein VLV83_26885 [Acidobacteriota bacterium]|nr:hypothetical protein [Acidobacteriota bacterium]
MDRFRLAWTLIFTLALGAPLAWGADDCQSVITNLDLPVKAKTTGKPKHVRWGLVNKVVHQVREATENRACHLTFGQVFAPKKDDVYFPLLDSVIRTAPEEELAGVSIHYVEDGEKAGAYSNRVIFEKSAYTQYYFQFTGPEGDLRAANRNLIDIASNRPIYMVPWSEIKNKALVSQDSSRR